MLNRPNSPVREREAFPRVLVVSHNVFSETSSMGKTLYQFFESWPKEKLAQLYLHTEMPTTHICERYFRITDFDVLHSFKRRGEPGKSLGAGDIREDLVSERVDEGAQAALYQWGRHRKPYMYLGRNLLWRLGKWYTQKLRDWVREFQPEVLFFASGDYSFAYRIALKIAEEFQRPLVTYVCDDYYICRRFSVSPLYYLYRRQFKSTFRKTAKRTASFVYICNPMKEDYNRLFGTQGMTLMTPSSFERIIPQKEERSVPVVSYVGSLGYDRWKVLAEVAKALRAIDSRQTLHVYTQDIKRAEKLTGLADGVEMHGAVNARQVEQILRSSDVMLHVESMDRIYRRRIKYSVSTKVADALASGTCLFAYGPEEIASIRYLSETKTACVATDQQELEPALREVLASSEKRMEYARRALEQSVERHDAVKNRERFRQLLYKASQKEREPHESTPD